MTEIAYTI